MRLDRSQPFGKITPPLQEPGMDRAAFYAQSGRMFDAYDNEIVPGQAAEEAAPQPQANGSPAPQGPLSVAAVLAMADNGTPFFEFRRQAKIILGPTCPAGKDAILVALKAAQAGYDARQSRRSSAPGPSAGMTWAGMTESSAEPPGASTQVAPTPPPPPQSSGVDLGAWGRGQKDYLFGEVRKAIRSSHSKVVTTTRDAVDFLIEVGIVPAVNARKVD